MKVDWYTLCYNEEFLIPFVIQYWEKLRSDGIDLHVTIFDNYSDDNSVALLSKYDWIDIREFQTDGMNDSIHQAIKNACWKQSKGKADFCIVSDFDEIIWGDLKGELERMKDGGYNVMGMKWYAFVGDNVPFFNKERYLHQMVGRGYQQYINHQKGFADFGKFLVFDPSRVDECNWSVGQHISNFKPSLNLYVSDKVVTFHVNGGLSEDWFVEKRRKGAKRLSDHNIMWGMGVEYRNPEQVSRQEYRENKAKSIDISAL